MWWLSGGNRYGSSYGNRGGSAVESTGAALWLRGGPCCGPG